jgi:hypothetical protein
MKRALIPGFHAECLISLVLIAVLFPASRVEGQGVSVRYRQGTLHGFLTLRDQAGTILATGDLTQVPDGDRIEARTVLHFRDGSINDETTVYSQKQFFRLISDRLIQRGPSFPNPCDIKIDMNSQQVSVRALAKGKEVVQTEHMDLPPDLSNGLMFFLIANLQADAPKIELPYLSPTSKPRMVKLAIVTDGTEEFKISGRRYQAEKYDVKVEIGGVTGVVAPMVGKQPPDTYVWVAQGGAPAILRVDTALYADGPVWSIRLASPAW